LIGFKLKESILVKRGIKKPKFEKKKKFTAEPNTFLLTMLLDSYPNFISGSLLAQTLGVSRVAVWSRINKLRLQGIDIGAVQNVGYRLVAEPIILNKNLVYAWLEHINYKNCQLFIYDSINSTNIETEKLLTENTSNLPIVVIANRQTKGKGRLNKKWTSPSGGNIYLSIGFKPNVEVLKLRKITLYLGMQIVKLLRNEFNTEKFMVKWPNDIILNEKKIGGILTEASIDSERVNSLIFGLGINLYQTPKLNRDKNKLKPTSISHELGIKPSLHPLTARIIKTVVKSYNNCINGKIDPNFISKWNEYDYLNNKDISVLKGNDLTKGNCQGIDHDGNLLLKFPNGSKKSFNSGEIDLLQ
tara:strand:- start:6719 stop:7792 length:1074 start_codon:yes stop_codon:yes gene_type:complete